MASLQLVSRIPSSLEDVKIVIISEGSCWVPHEGPVLLVGYHMLMGLELTPLCEGFLREKNIMVRGLATLYSKTFESSSSEFSLSDWMREFGTVPVTASNLFKLPLKKSSFVQIVPEQN